MATAKATATRVAAGAFDAGQNSHDMYLYAAVKLGVPDAAVPTNDAVMQVAGHLQGGMMPQDREVLVTASRRFLENPVKNIKPWMIAADLTGDRAGLLLCGDLATAAKMMTRVPSLVTDLTPCPC